MLAACSLHALRAFDMQLYKLSFQIMKTYTEHVAGTLSMMVVSGMHSDDVGGTRVGDVVSGAAIGASGYVHADVDGHDAHGRTHTLQRA